MKDDKQLTSDGEIFVDGGAEAAAAAEELPRKKHMSVNRSKLNDLVFYCLLMAFPVAQFCVFWIGVNGNSILLAFQNIDGLTGEVTWVGLNNLKTALIDIVTDPSLVTGIKNSLILYVCGTAIGVSLALLFSYYITKKYPLSGLFKIMLFMPSIISVIAMTVMYNYIVERAIPELISMITGVHEDGLLTRQSTALATLIFYAIWFSFGTSVLMYLGAMSGVSESVIEAAQVDGASPTREFFSIILPSIWPTLSTFLVTGSIGIFTNQMNLFTFYGTRAPENLVTLGYLLYAWTQGGSRAEYPYLSSIGIIFTCVAVPLTMIVRKLLEKFGPSTD